MEGRSMIVGGRQELVGSNGGYSHHDYDSLMEHMGAEPTAAHPAAPPPAAPPQVVHPQHHHPHHHQHHPHHPHPHAAPMFPYVYERAAYPVPYAYAPAPAPVYAPPAPQVVPYHAAPAPQHHDGRSLSVETRHPKSKRQFPIGFRSQTIPPGEERDIEVKPQVLFRGERLAVSPSTARFFGIVDIKVGKDSQLAATGEMPAEAFSALAVGVRMELDTAEPGIVLTLRVRNRDTQPQVFDAVLYGTVLE